MKITTINRQIANTIAGELFEAAKKIGQKYGLTVQEHRGTFSVENFVKKIEFKTDKAATNATNLADSTLSLYNLKIGDNVRGNDPSDLYTIVGYNPRARRMPVKLIHVTTKAPIKTSVEFCKFHKI